MRRQIYQCQNIWLWWKRTIPIIIMKMMMTIMMVMMVMMILRALQGWLIHAMETAAVPSLVRYFTIISINTNEASSPSRSSLSWSSKLSWQSSSSYCHSIMMFGKRISSTDSGWDVQACRDCQLGWWLLWRGFYPSSVNIITTHLSFCRPENLGFIHECNIMTSGSKIWWGDKLAMSLLPEFIYCPAFHEVSIFVPSLVHESEIICTWIGP